VGRYDRESSWAGQLECSRAVRRRVTAVGSLWRAARSGWRSIDRVAFGGLLGAVVFTAGGVVAVVLSFIPDAWPVQHVGAGVALGVILVGIVGLAVPWERWDARYQLIYPVAGFVLMAIAARGAGTAGAAYVTVFTLLFVLVGFSQPPGTCVALLPVALGVLRIGAGDPWGVSHLVEVTFELAVGVVAGESVGLVLQRQRRAEIRIERLLNAVRVIVRVTREREGAEVLASLAADLMDADAAVVYIADRRAPHRLLSRAWSGHPALADSAPLILERSQMRPGGIEVFPDARVAGLAEGWGSARARTAALVPLPGDDAPLGAVVLLWGRSRSHLQRSALHVAELLSKEAGQMFTRMRAAEVLVLEAETDPLTSLANRRTFARALATLMPGDAVVVVDLDHFKVVNDTYGHVAGDETLRSLAECMRSVARQVDCIARYGGEEFALVLAAAGDKGSRVAMQRLRRAWAATQPLATFSAGVAIHDQAELPEVTLQRADLALYRAKESGRDRVEHADCEIVLA